jgi:transposase-like protein
MWSLSPVRARPRCGRSRRASGSPRPVCIRWLKIADTDDGTRPGATTTESAELRELRKRNKLLEQENEILRRAAAYFAKEISPQ